MIDVTKTFLPLLKKTPGRVVNLSSILGTCTLAKPPTQIRGGGGGGWGGGGKNA